MPLRVLTLTTYRDRYRTRRPHLDEPVPDRPTSPDVDRMRLDTVRATYPPHEQDQFLASVPGLIDLRVADRAR